MQNRKKRDPILKMADNDFLSVCPTLCASVCLLKMFGSNCIFTDVRGQTLLSSPAEVKLIFPFFFDVKVPSSPLPRLLLLPRPQHTRRMAIFHLPSCCLPRSLWLFCSFFSSLSVWLCLLYCLRFPSALLFTPPLSLTRRFFDRTNIFSFECAAVQVQVCSEGMSVCSSVSLPCLALSLSIE